MIKFDFGEWYACAENVSLCFVEHEITLCQNRILQEKNIVKIGIFCLVETVAELGCSNHFFALSFSHLGKTECHQGAVSEGETCSLDKNNADKDTVMPILKVECCQGFDVWEALVGVPRTLAQEGTVIVKTDKGSYCGTENGQYSSTQACAAQSDGTKPAARIPRRPQGDRIPASPDMVTWSRQDDGFYFCDVCGYSTKNPRRRVIHSRIHTGERPFTCDLCPNTFMQSSHLARHRRSHTGERPHACTVCRAAFLCTSDLERHVRIHTGERPYQCTFCSSSFTQRKTLTNHLRIHTGERPYKCYICNKRFATDSNTKRHIRLHM